MKRYQNYVFDLYGTLVDIHTDEGKLGFWKKVAQFYRLHGAVYLPRELQERYLEAVHRREAGLKDRLDHIRAADSHESSPEIRLEDVFKELYENRGVKPSDGLIRETAREFRKASTTHLRCYAGCQSLAPLQCPACVHRVGNADPRDPGPLRWDLYLLGSWLPETRSPLFPCAPGRPDAGSRRLPHDRQRPGQ